MTDIEHMIAWIESSQPHYVRLCILERDRKECEAVGALTQYNLGLALRAFNIISSAYDEATRCGDMFPEQWSAAQLLSAAKALLEWELE